MNNLLYMLTSGELQVSFPPEGARASKLSQVLGEGRTSIAKCSMQRTSSRVPQGRIERMGSLIGWSAPHITARPNAYTVRASRDSVLMSLSRQELAMILEKHPQDAHIFKKATDHANKMINPIKRVGSNSLAAGAPGPPEVVPSATVAGGETGETALKTDRRCSTTEMTQMLQLKDKVRSAGKESSVGRAPKQRDSSCRDTSSGRESINEFDGDQHIREAAESGWLLPRKSKELRLSRSKTTSIALGDMSLEGKFALLLDELVSLKSKVTCLQTSTTKSFDEVAALRKLISSRPSTAQSSSW